MRETSFIKLYEALSILNEAGPSPSMPTLKLSTIIGIDENGPIIETPSEEHPSILNFVDIQMTKEDNKNRDFKLPDNINDWAIGSNKRTCFQKPGCIHYVLKCSNPNCPEPTKRILITAGSLYKKIYSDRQVKHGKTSKKSAVELMRCMHCATQMAHGREVKVPLTNIPIIKLGGISRDGIVQTQDIDSSLFKYLNKQCTVDNNSGIPSDPAQWFIFDVNSNTTFYFNCPNCGVLVPKTTKQLRARYSGISRDNLTILSPATFAYCESCSKTQHTSIMLENEEYKYLRERISPIFIEGDIVNSDAILSRSGYDLLAKQNSDSADQAVRELLDDLAFTFKYDKDPKVKIFKRIYKSTRLLLPCICPNKDCQTANGKAVEYWSSPVLITFGVYKGCPKCQAHAAVHTSQSERLLRELIEKVFQVKHEKTKKIKPYYDIDILFTYKGQKYGIEYDGAKYHKDPRTIDTDERKVKAFTEQQQIKFIRVRERGCASFDRNNAPAELLELPKSFAKLVNEKWEASIIKLLTEIGKYIVGEDYEISEDVRSLVNDFINRAY